MLQNQYRYYGDIVFDAKIIDSIEITLLCNVSELSATHRKMNDEKSLEITRLTDTLRQRDMEIKQMRDDDAQRATILTSAIQTYVTRSPYPK